MFQHSSLKPSLALLLLAGCAPDPESPAEVAPINYTLTELKDDAAASCSHAGVEQELAQVMNELDLVGCVVAIGDNDEVLYMHAAGSAELDANQNELRPYDVHLPSAVGSTAKLITAVSLVRLWELGYLGNGDLDEITIGDMQDPAYGLVLPSAYDGSWIHDITLYELLTHTSGINEAEGNWSFVSDFLDWAPFSVVTPYTVDWTGSILELTADELALAQPGAHPRLAVKVLQPPPTRDYPNTDPLGHYSNINFAYIAAIVDAVVTRPGFAGYDAYLYGIEPGFESWTWYVWTGGGVDTENGLLTLALNHPWREAANEIPGLPADYLSPSQPAPDWDYFGWEVGSAGWTLTAGDLARMGLARRKGLFVDDWSQISGNKVTVDGVGSYGLGFQRKDVQENAGKYWYMGHGGTIRGYTGAAYTIDDPTRDGGVIGLACNTAPVLANGSYAPIHIPIAHRLWKAWDPDTLDCQLDDANAIVSGGYMPMLMDAATARIEKAGMDGALRYALRKLSSTEGRLLLDALEEGDTDLAAQCLLVVLGDTSGRWTCR